MEYNNNLPIYLQVINQIKKDMIQGRLPMGEKLPSTRELAVQYQIAIQYDETAQAPYFHYTDNAGTVHEVWFEDARSLSARLQFIAEYGLLGGGIWNMMRPFSQLWLLLDGLFELS